MTEETMLELRRAVVFAILTQDIQGQSPGYIQDKWHSVQNTNYPEQMLGYTQTVKLEDWRRGWRNCLPNGEDK